MLTGKKSTVSAMQNEVKAARLAELKRTLAAWQKRGITETYWDDEIAQLERDLAGVEEKEEVNDGTRDK